MAVTPSSLTSQPHVWIAVCYHRALEICASPHQPSGVPLWSDESFSLLWFLSSLKWSQFIFPNASQCKLISIKMSSYSTPSEMSLMTTKSLGLWGAYRLLLSPQTYNLFRYTLVPTTSTTALFILLWLVFCSVLCFWDRASLDNHASLQLRICPSQSPESWKNRRTLSREIGCSLSQREREDFSSPDQC